jgi:hypothetical protein
MVSNATTGATTLSFSPIVMDEQREAWQNFTLRTAMAGWLKETNPELYIESRYRKDSKARFPVPKWKESGIFPFIARLDNDFSPRPIVADRRPHYIPSCMADYTIQVNLDTNSNPNSAVFNEGVIKNKKLVLSTTINSRTSGIYTTIASTL